MIEISQDNRNILSGILCFANIIIMLFLTPVLFLFSMYEGLMGILFGIFMILIQILPIYAVSKCVPEKKPVFLGSKSVDTANFEEMMEKSEIKELKPTIVIAFICGTNLIFLIIFSFAFGIFRNFPTFAVLWILNIVFYIIAGIIFNPMKLDDKVYHIFINSKISLNNYFYKNYALKSHIYI